MSLSNDEPPTVLFEPEPETESMPQLDDENSTSSQSGSKDTEATPETATSIAMESDDKPEMQDDNSLSFGTGSVNESEKMDLEQPQTNVVNSSDFQKVMDSINDEQLHEDKLLDFVSNLDDHPSSQSLDEKLLDSVVENETPEETMQVERLMESIHNEKASINDGNENRGETLTFHKIDQDGQITDHKVLDENDLKNNKELRLDNGNVTLTSDNKIILSNNPIDVVSGDIKDSNLASTSTTKEEDVDMTPEKYLQEVTGEIDDNQDVPVYDTVENKNDPKVFEATKDCLQAMEGIDSRINEDAPISEDVASTVEDVLSALHSEVSLNEKPTIKSDDDDSTDVKSDSKISVKTHASITGKRVVKDTIKQVGVF